MNSQEPGIGRYAGVIVLGVQMFDAALVLLVIAALLVVVGISQPLAIRLRPPPSVLLAAIGVAIGASPAILRHVGLPGSPDTAAGLFTNLPVSPETFIYVFLPLLVFEAGLATDVKRTIEDAVAICSGGYRDTGHDGGGGLCAVADC